jgi:hypothetical protein
MKECQEYPRIANPSVMPEINTDCGFPPSPLVFLEMKDPAFASSANLRQKCSGRVRSNRVQDWIRQTEPHH